MILHFLKPQNARMQKWQNAGTPERRNAGTPERRNTGTPERRNAGTPNCSNRVRLIYVSILDNWQTLHCHIIWIFPPFVSKRYPKQNWSGHVATFENNNKYPVRAKFLIVFKCRIATVATCPVISSLQNSNMYWHVTKILAVQYFFKHNSRNLLRFRHNLANLHFTGQTETTHSIYSLYYTIVVVMKWLFTVTDSWYKQKRPNPGTRWKQNRQKNTNLGSCKSKKDTVNPQNQGQGWPWGVRSYGLAYLYSLHKSTLAPISYSDSLFSGAISSH